MKSRDEQKDRVADKDPFFEPISVTNTSSGHDEMPVRRPRGQSATLFAPKPEVEPVQTGCFCFKPKK